MTTTIKQATQFFAKNAGYSVPPGRMVCALHMAKAEQFAQDHDWTTEWEIDVDGCSGCDCGSPDCACSAGTPHETLACALKDADGQVLASLCGICEPSNDYQRVIEAELALEAMHEFDEELATA